MKTLITATLILFSIGLKAQTTTVNRQTVYLASTVDKLLADQAKAFALQITTLTNRLDQQQTAINTQGLTVAQIRPVFFDSTIRVRKGLTVDTVGTATQIILK